MGGIAKSGRFDELIEKGKVAGDSCNIRQREYNSQEDDFSSTVAFYGWSKIQRKRVKSYAKELYRNPLVIGILSKKCKMVQRYANPILRIRRFPQIEEVEEGFSQAELVAICVI